MRVIPFGKPMIGDEERKAVMEVLQGDTLVHGPRIKEFETQFAAYTGAKRGVAVASCTAALHLVYFDLGLKPGDEVIVPAQTHTATAHAVELCGAKPVFVDSEKETGNIDINQIETKVSRRTRAISVVHFLGMPVNMQRITEIANKHSLFVVEDCALAIGSYFKDVHVGLHGDAGCFSFYPVKQMTTAEGGMLITRHAEIADRIARKRAFGVDRQINERSIPGVYDVTMLGFNYRLNEIQAALGIEQLKKMNQFLARRRENHEALSAGLRGVEEVDQFQSGQGDYQSSYYCFSALLNRELASRRFEIVNYLKEKGIGTSVYYPSPVPLLSYYKNKYGYTTDHYPVAVWISENSIALPVGPHLTGENIKYMTRVFKEAVYRVKSHAIA